MRAVACLVVASLLAPACSAQIPDVLYPDDAYHKLPIWVRADRVLSGDGKPNLALFHPVDATAIEELLAAESKDGCVRIRFLPTDVVSPPDISSLETLIREATGVFVGKVVDTAFGFSSYVPGQLLDLAPTESLLGKDSPEEHVLLFVPVADFALGSTRICKTDSQVGEAPSVGEELLVVFAPFPGPSKRSFLKVVDGTCVVRILPDGTLAPQSRKNESVCNLPPSVETRAQLMDLVVAALRRRIS